MVLESVPPSPEEQGKVWEFDGWHQRDPIGVWVAESYTEKQRDGRIVQRIALGSIQRISDERLAELTAPPPFDGADPVRGRVTFRSMMDYSGGVSPLVHLVTPSGLQQVALPSQASTKQPSEWLRPMGWVAAVSIAVALVWLRIRAGARV